MNDSIDIKINELNKSLNELIQNLILRMEEISNHFYQGENVLGNERMVYLIEDIRVIVDGLRLTKGELLNYSIIDFNDKLNKIMRELENEDFNFVADLLLYDLKPLFLHWKEQVDNA